jgi:glutathione-specific gamma-glutamylcyclotransferase
MEDDLWIFAYGSLIWDPCFDPVERVPARLTGWHRSFCMRSVRYRGTEAEPGLVLALDERAGAQCDGIAFRISADAAEGALSVLRERELGVTSAYVERRLPVDLTDGRRVGAVTFVIDRSHGQYCGTMSLEEQARLIAVRSGVRGPNRDYLWHTAAHLAELGLADPELDWLASRVRALSPPDHQ